MTYTTEQVIELYSQYRNCKDYIKGDSFEDWLMKYESSQTPVKDQLIWVTHNPNYKWHERYFHEFDKLTPVYVKNDEDVISHYNYYSLTDPNL